MIHCPGHQTDEGFVSQGNRLADRCARQAVQMERGEESRALPATSMCMVELRGQNTQGSLIPTAPEDEFASLYTALDNLHPEGKWQGGWWVVQGRVQLPRAILHHVTRQVHQSTHSVSKIMYNWLMARYCNEDLRPLCHSEVSSCPVCLQNNPHRSKPIPAGHLREARYLGEAWQVNLTEVPE